MREIKFRAWDKYGERMIAQGGERANGQQFGGVAFGHCAVVNEDDTYFQDSVLIPMQYTGLKDKNGVEIYEGDVVRADNQVGKIIFERAAFIVDGFYEPIFDDPTDAFSEAAVEVIGNIYENPELLEKAS